MITTNQTRSTLQRFHLKINENSFNKNKQTFIGIFEKGSTFSYVNPLADLRVLNIKKLQMPKKKLNLKTLMILTEMHKHFDEIIVFLV